MVDAETRQPPPSVRVQIWETPNEPGRGSTSPGTVSYVLEVQADGYWPEHLTNQVTSEPEVDLHVGLVRAPLAAGIVLTPSGEAAQSAARAVRSLVGPLRPNPSGRTCGRRIPSLSS